MGFGERGSHFSALFSFMRIVVDVMGGDHGPEVIIDGARLALESNASITELYFVGREDEIKAAMSGLLEPVFREVYKGKAEVRETFRISKVGNVAGCLVQDGVIPSRSEVRLLRDNVVVYTGKIASLRRFKDDVSEVKSGQECGITLENFADVKQGDAIEAFVTERVATEVFA